MKNPSWPLENQAAPHGKIVEHVSVKGQPHPKDPLFAQVFQQTQHLRFISKLWLSKPQGITGAERLN